MSETDRTSGPVASPGPLDGARVLELDGIGPGPFCGMLLADMGADVVRLERAGGSMTSPAGIQSQFDITNRNKRSMIVDLKSPAGVETALQLVERADILIDPFRPGVTERLGLGPEDCNARNPRLVYGRMTGWGQDGPLAQEAGHDINYIALSGALGSICSADGAPVIPLNLVGDYGGGALYLAFGLLCALHESKHSGRGQVVDAAMTDGAASLMSVFYGLRAAGNWPGSPGENLIDGGAPYYNVYETADGGYVSVGALEPKFYAALLRCLSIDPGSLPPQTDPSGWRATKARFAETFRTRTRAEWIAAMVNQDACFAPVLRLDEAPDHPHNHARGTFQTLDGVVQPGPAPRLSRTPGTLRTSAPGRGQHQADILRDWLGPVGSARNTSGPDKRRQE